MKPYYHDEASGISIYHGDCREILPTLGENEFDLLLTDPPYVGLSGGVVHAGLGGVAKSVSRNETVGDEWGASLDWVAAAWRATRLGAVVFCSYHSVDSSIAALEAVGARRVSLFTWYKRNSPPSIANVPRFTTEFAWGVKKIPGLKWRQIKDTLIDVPMPVAGCMATERFTDLGGKAIHPTQKPLAAMMPFVRLGQSSILEPFAGTGTTLVAAKLAGCKALGIEKNERFCELAASRLSQGVLNFGEVA